MPNTTPVASHVFVICVAVPMFPSASYALIFRVSACVSVQVTVAEQDVVPVAADHVLPSLVYSQEATPLPPVSAKVLLSVNELGTYIPLVGEATTVPYVGPAVSHVFVI